MTEAYFLVGIKPNEYCSNHLSKNIGRNMQYVLINKKLEECISETLQGFHFDSILCINDLEHIEDDIGGLSLFEKK